MIRVEHLVKRYGANVAVDDVSFSVAKGDVVGFLGPNGAGKSTTLRILAGFLGMTAGKVTIAGHDVALDSFAARSAVGYMPEAVPLYPEMRVVEYLAFRAELKRVARGERRARVDDAMAKARVDDVATTSIGRLSKGYRQRVGLADALVANPPILILDEPTAGLDPNQIREVRAVLRALGGDHTILLSTHILSEVEATCGRVVVIAKGKLLADGATADLRGMRRTAGLAITVRGDPAQAARVLRAVPGIARVQVAAVAEGAPAKRDEAPAAKGGDGGHAGDLSVATCTWKKKIGDDAIARAAEKAVGSLVLEGLFVREAKAIGGSLEDVFAELTRGAPPDEAGADADEGADDGADRAGAPRGGAEA